MHWLIRLWRDERGSTETVATLLLYAILVFGVITGVVALRDQIVQEFGDLAVALDSLDQSWHADNVGAGYHDTPSLTDPPFQEPAGLNVQAPSRPEGS